MLRQRVLTAIALLAVVLAILLLLPAVYFDILMLAVVVAGGWEWAALAGADDRLRRSGFVTFLLLSCGGILQAGPLLLAPLLLLSAAWWPLALYCILQQPRPLVLLRSVPLLLIVGWIILVPSWVAVYSLQRMPGVREFLVLWFIALVAAADVGAYFAGKVFGRRKLAPAVSPNKTREGLVGGMVATALVAVAGARLGPETTLAAIPVALVIGAALLLAVFSVVGDLFESLLKRSRQLKDSGSLLPGHGGVMDRLDSLTAVLPLFVLLLMQVVGLPA